MNKDLIEEFLDYKEHIGRCSNHTIRAYCKDLKQYSDFLLSSHNKNLSESQSKHIQYYLNYLGKSKISSKSMARKLASIKSFFRYLSNNNIIAVNIAQSIKTPNIPKRLPHFLTVNEIKNLLDPTCNKCNTLYISSFNSLKYLGLK